MRFRTTSLIVAISLLAAAGAVLGAFMMRNGGWVVVRVPWLSWDGPELVRSVEYEAQLSWLLAGTFATGMALVMLLVVLPSGLRRAYRQGRDRRQIQRLENELAQLRSLPITHPAPLEDLADDEEGGASPDLGEIDDEPAPQRGAAEAPSR